jgi:hypothetical protein
VTPPLTTSEATWVLSKLAYLMLCRSIRLLALLARGDADKDLEILVLHHPLTVLRRHVSHPTREPADRALLAAVSRVLPRARWSCLFVKPETLLGWHRRLVAGAWTSPRRGQRRPPLDHDVQQLIVPLATDNPGTTARSAGTSAPPARSHRAGSGSRARAAAGSHASSLAARTRDHRRRNSARLGPMRGLKQDHSARAVIAGHAFVQNIRRGHDELAVEEPVHRRVAVAFDELAWRSDARLLLRLKLP